MMPPEVLTAFRYLPPEVQPPFVYGLVDPLDPGHVRYVGLTMKQRDRPYQHARKARKYPEKHSYLLHWIRNMQEDGRNPSILILEKLTDIANSKFVGFVEQCYIKSLREIGHKLTNLTDGGEGVLNPTSEIRQKMSESAKARCARGVSDVTRSRLSAAGKGRKLTKAHIENVRKSLFGKKHSAEWVANARAGHGPTYKPQTAEHRAKNSAANKGRVRSPEFCAGLSAQWKDGRRGPVTQATREKQRASNLAWRARKKAALDGQ